MNPTYEFVIRKPREAAARIEKLEKINAELEKVASYSLLMQNEKLKTQNEFLRRQFEENAGGMFSKVDRERLKELEAQLTAAIDWHWNESVAGTTRQEIIDNINELAKKQGK